jgi:integrase
VITTLRTFAYPAIGDMNVAEIDTSDVLRAIEPIWISKTETASRVRGRIESVLGWATVRGYRSGDNPARWRGHLEEALPKRGKVAAIEHHAALPYLELPGFMAELRKREGMAARALEFTIHTAARRGSTLGAQWDEIDFDNRAWVIPAERMKAGKPHTVPLSISVVELLRGLYREDGNQHVFLGMRPGGGLGAAALAKLLQRMGHGDVTGSARASATGRPSGPITRARSPRWLWRTRSATR